MHSVFIKALLAIFLLTGGALAATTSMVPIYDHIVIVVEENHGYSQIIGNSNAPFINSLIPLGALLTHDHAITHPSLPNYLALYAGSTFGVTSDTPQPESDPTLYTVLHHAGLTFIGWVDGGSDPDHVPWQNFPEGTSVQRNFTSFPQGNFPALPKISFVIPSDTHNMHSASIAQGDLWLQQHLGAYIAWAPLHNSLFVLTWDENNGTAGNRIATILVGTHIALHTLDGSSYNHYNLLSTILAAGNLTAPRRAATAGHFAVFQP